MDNSHGLNAGSSSGVLSSVSRRCSIPTVIPQIQSVSRMAVEKIFCPEVKKIRIDRTTTYAGKHIHPALRRIQGKKRHNMAVKKYRAAFSELDAVVECGDVFPPQCAGASPSTTFDVGAPPSRNGDVVIPPLYDTSSLPQATCNVDDYDREFFERCARIRAEQDESRKLDEFFSENYDCCVVYEDASLVPYEIPPEYSSASEPSVQFGDVLRARIAYEQCDSVAYETEVKNKDLRDYIVRQGKSKDFDGFPKINPHGDEYSQLCLQRVSIPATRDDTKKFHIPRSTASKLIARPRIQDGTVIYCPQGTGRTYASLRYPAIIDSSHLPITFRNKQALRKIADSGNIVLTNRLRDCDEDTIYLIPDKLRFLANGYSLSLRPYSQLVGELNILNALRARKFRLASNQYLVDFLKYRMRVYRQVK